MNEIGRAEFSFDARKWHRMLFFLAMVFCVGGFLAGLIGGHPWIYILKCAVGLPLFFTPLFWLIGFSGYHRSYLITPQGITIRRRGRDIEQLAWPEIADIRSHPLTIVTRSGRCIKPVLMRHEYEKARDFLLNALKTFDRNA